MGKSRYSRRHSRKMRSSRRMPFMRFGGDGGVNSRTILGVQRVLPTTALQHELTEEQISTLTSIIEAAAKTDPNYNAANPGPASNAVYDQLKAEIAKYNNTDIAKAIYKMDTAAKTDEVVIEKDPLIIFQVTGGYIVIEKSGRIGDGKAIRHFVYMDGKINTSPPPSFGWFGGRKSRKSSKKSRKSRRKTSRK